MGLSSISIGAVSAAYRPSLSAHPVSAAKSATPAAQSTNAIDRKTDQRPKTDTATIGFGVGTVSTASAVLHTVSKTVEAARSVVESLAEVRARISQVTPAVSPQDRNATTAQDRTVSAPVQSGQNQGRANTRVEGPTNSLQPTTSIAAAPLGGKTSPANGGVPQAGEAQDVTGQTVSATVAPNAPRINLLA